MQPCIFNGEMYGSTNSIHSSSSLVYAKPSSNNADSRPCFVSKFIIVTVILNVDGVQKKLKVLLAFVTWLSDHEHRHWFPQPVGLACILF